MAWQIVGKGLWVRYGRKAAVWVIKQIGGQKVFDAVEVQLNGVVARGRAIKKARQTREGRWGPILLEDRARYVVYSGDKAVDIFPGIRGDITKATKTYNTSLLRSPDEVPSIEVRRWVEERWARLRTDVNEGDETPASPPGAEVSRRAMGASAELTGQALFGAMVEQLPALLKQLTGAQARTVAAHDGIPEAPGVYLFSEGVTPIYVGQTRNLRSRLRQHTSLASRENQAALAWRLALKDAREAGLPAAGTRKVLESDPDFVEYFRAAKTQVAAMGVRFIELEDPVTRTVFEIYAARALGTDEFNAWETH